MTEDISRQLSDSEKNVRVIDDHKRRKKVKISTGNIRDGGEWDFRSGGSHWNSEGEERGTGPGLMLDCAGFEGSRWQLQQHMPNSTGCCSYLWISKLMIIIFTLTNLLTIACGGVVFTLGLTGYWSTLQIFSYIMVSYLIESGSLTDLLLPVDRLQLSHVLGDPRHHHGRPRPPRHLPEEEENDPPAAALVHDGGHHDLRAGDALSRLHGVLLPPAYPHQTPSQHVRLVQCQIRVQALLHNALLEKK